MTQDIEKMSERKALEQYDEYLDEVYDNVYIAGLSYATSEALKLVDNIAYRTGFNDWCDAEGIEIV